MTSRSFRLYVVDWPEHGIAKAGITNKRDRLAKFKASGARVVKVWQGKARADETELHKVLARRFNRAFKRRTDLSESLLGQWSLGYTECYAYYSSIDFERFLKTVEGVLTQRAHEANSHAQA